MNPPTKNGGCPELVYGVALYGGKSLARQIILAKVEFAGLVRWSGGCCARIQGLPCRQDCAPVDMIWSGYWGFCRAINSQVAPWVKHCFGADPFEFRLTILIHDLWVISSFMLSFQKNIVQ